MRQEFFKERKIVRTNKSQQMRDAILALALPMSAADIEKDLAVLQYSRLTHIKVRIMLERMFQRGLLTKDAGVHPVLFSKAINPPKRVN